MHKRLTEEKKFVDDSSMSKEGRTKFTSIPATYATKQAANQLANKWDLSVTKLLERVIEWFGRQEDAVQMAALHRLPPGFEVDVLELVMRKLAEKPPQPFTGVVKPLDLPPSPHKPGSPGTPPTKGQPEDEKGKHKGQAK